MVQQLRGAISVRRTCGSGVVIEVLLPRIVEDQPARKNRTPVVLVVSDDVMARELTCDLLKDAGYKVLEAAHGKEAESMLAGSEVDLMITDIVMPEQDGLETILSVRAVHPGLKIIAVGDRPGGYQVRTAKLLGADAVMSKPLTRCVLCDTVREQIGGARGGNI
jgi:DNA-binding response OmpR family regulator